MKTSRFIALCCTIFGILVGPISCQEEFVVEIPELGKIRGTNRTTSPEGETGVSKPYIQFLGIPFAKSERFMPSELLEDRLSPEDGEFDATLAGAQCFQPNGFEPFMSEDCLNINVYTSKKYNNDDNELRPVIFFIHGGAFTVGSGHGVYSGLRILNREVVLVTFNYRLGLQGFFSLATESAPGNAGLYDALNALKWTNKYIKYFGGNPELITIAGQSAGSAIVTHLLASPLSEGLFHRAIAASGSALNIWGTSINPVKESLRLAEMIGCHNSTQNPNPDLELIVSCLKSPPPMLLVNTLRNYQVEERQAGRLGVLVVSPVVQDFPIPHIKIVPEHPEDVFSDGRQANVPLMMGATRHDGSYSLGVTYHRFIKDNQHENDTEFMKRELIPQILNSFGIQDRPLGTHETIARNFLGDARSSGDFNEMYPGLMDIFSVYTFKSECYYTAQMHSSLNATFWYSFDFRGPSTIFPILFPGDGPPPFPGGVTHGDDLIYLFQLTSNPFTELESKVSTQMLDYWSNFATTGDPTPSSTNSVTWPLLNLSEEYLIIKDESVAELNYIDSWVGAGLETTPPPIEISTPEMTDPTSDTTVPVSDTTVPVSDTTIPVSDTTVPVSDTTVPVSDTTVPVSDTTVPVSDTTVPVSDTTVPVSDTTVTVSDTTVTVSDTTVPVSDTTVPVSDTTVTVSDTTVTVSDTTVPVSDTTVPVSDTTVPVSDTTVPVSDTTVPVSDTTVTVSDTTVTVSDTTVPVSDTTVPVSDTTVTVSDTTVTVSDTTVPVSDTTVPVSDTTVTVSDTTVPVSDTTVPVSDTTVPVSDTTVTVSDTTVPVSDTTVPVSDTTVPVSDTTVPVSDTTVPVSDTTVPISDTTIPVSDTTVPVSDTTVPASDTTVPVSDTTVPVSDTTVPVSDTTVPVSDTTVPISDTTVPVSDTTVPVSDTTTPVTTTPSSTTPISITPSPTPPVSTTTVSQEPTITTPATITSTQTTTVTTQRSTPVRITTTARTTIQASTEVTSDPPEQTTGGSTQTAVANQFSLITACVLMVSYSVLSLA